jgi:peptidoglycan/LPS O-acetylase OafA/YrhL
MSVLTAPVSENTAPPVPTKRRLDYIDALRGAACFWVLLHHSFSTATVPAGVWHAPVHALGMISDIRWLGVNLFLVLSGFCLFYPLAARYNLATIQLNLTTFAKRRMGRILPPYYIAIVLLTLIEVVASRLQKGHWDWHVGIQSPKDLIVHLLMLHNLSHHTIQSVSSAFWSLALEAQLYVIFPLLIVCLKRFGLKSILLLTLAVSVTWQVVCLRRYGLSLHWSPDLAVHYDALPGRCFEFAVGMVAAALVARPRPRQRRVALALILTLILPALYFVLKVSWFGPLSNQVWGVIFASALVLLCETSNIRLEKNPVTRWFVWLGAISYSVYLVHFPLIRIFSADVMHLSPGAGGEVLAGLIRLPFLIVLGYLFHIAFERPFMPGKPRTQRQAEVSAAVSPAL